MLNLIAALLGSFFFLKSSPAGAIMFGPPRPPESWNVWNAARVKSVAAELKSRYGLNADPAMIAAMSKIKSNFNPKATRYEIHLRDSSYGLMQTMTKTAQWLYDTGYKDFARPTRETLVDGRTSIYFGMAYVDYLSNYAGKARSEQWIVESYNGGPGNSNSQTRKHLAKYQTAKTEVA